MKLDEECKGCLYNSQMKKVEREQTDKEKFARFKDGVKKLCLNPPENYCAPLLMRDIDSLHREIFGKGIDYTKEKSLFNGLLLNMENELYARIISSPDPVEEGLKFAMAANYIDFARLSDLNAGSVELVISAAERASVDKVTLEKFKDRLKAAKTLCYLHDNCGEIVLDKILIRVIKNLYPQIKVTSVVRGSAIINDVTEHDAEEVGLKNFAEVVSNGAGVPGTYLKEISPETSRLLRDSDVILSKGLGNLETLYGEGYSVFYAFNCKCRHIAARFNLGLWSAAFIFEDISEVHMDLRGVVIETERAKLRLFNAGDLNDFYEYAKVEGVGENAGWSPHKSIEESKRILDGFLEKKHDFAVVVDGKTVGSLGFKSPDLSELPEESKAALKGKRVIEIGYTLSKDYWGKGLMTECCKAAIKWVFENTDADLILCGHFDYNDRSRRVIEKCGFVYLCRYMYKTRYGTTESCKLYSISRNLNN